MLAFKWSLPEQLCKCCQGTGVAPGALGSSKVQGHKRDVDWMRRVALNCRERLCSRGGVARAGAGSISATSAWLLPSTPLSEQNDGPGCTARQALTTTLLHRQARGTPLVHSKCGLSAGGLQHSHSQAAAAGVVQGHPAAALHHAGLWEGLQLCATGCVWSG